MARIDKLANNPAILAGIIHLLFTRFPFGRADLEQLWFDSFFFQFDDDLSIIITE
jgi:hypothetical protein